MQDSKLSRHRGSPQGVHLTSFLIGIPLGCLHLKSLFIGIKGGGGYSQWVVQTGQMADRIDREHLTLQKALAARKKKHAMEREQL